MNKVLIFILGFYISLIINQNSSKESINVNKIKSTFKFVKNIDRGGCGFFAYKLFKRLDPDRYTIISINNLSHVAIYDKETDLIIDSQGARPIFSFQLRYNNCKFDEVSSDSLRILLDKKEIWKSDFNREDTCLIDDFVNNL